MDFQGFGRGFSCRIFRRLGVRVLGLVSLVLGSAAKPSMPKCMSCLVLFQKYIFIDALVLVAEAENTHWKCSCCFSICQGKCEHGVAKFSLQHTHATEQFNANSCGLNIVSTCTGSRCAIVTPSHDYVHELVGHSQITYMLEEILWWHCRNPDTKHCLIHCLGVKPVTR